MAVFGLWGTADEAVILRLLAVAIAFLGAYAWGVVMWRMMFRDIRVELRRSAEAGRDPGSNGD
jgi:hypothetical protein